MLCLGQQAELTMMKPDKPPLIIITGGSGVGKSTILHELVQRSPELVASCSVTTRWPPRDTELFASDYYFIDQSRFDWLVSTNQLVAHTTIYGHRYGTIRVELERLLARNKTPVLILDPDGLESIKKSGFNYFAIYLDFPNSEAQKKRLLEREPTINNEELDSRLSTAATWRAWAAKQARSGQLRIVVNDKLGTCLDDINQALSTVI